jgi:hypothetical protein
LRENQFGECSFSSEIDLPFFEADKYGVSRSCICPSKEHIYPMDAGQRPAVHRSVAPACRRVLVRPGRRQTMTSLQLPIGVAMHAWEPETATAHQTRLLTAATCRRCTHAAPSRPRTPSPRGRGRTSHGPTRGDAWKTKKILLTNAADTGTTVPPVHSFHCRPAAS